MNLFVYDTFTDPAGTHASAHNVEVGGPIIPTPGSDAEITTSNRMRGQATSGGTFAYTAVPANKNWQIEFSVYVASVSGAISITCCGYTLNYSVSNLYWNLNGGQLPSPLHSGEFDYSPGQRIKGKIVALNGVVTVTVDGTQIFNATDTAPPAIAAPGFVFFEQDTDSTGFQLESFSAFDRIYTPIPPAGSLNPATVFAYFHDGTGAFVAGKLFHLRMVKANTGYDIWISDPFASQPSDSGGLSTATAEIGASYQVSPDGKKWSEEFVVSANPFHLAELVGNGWT